MFYLKTCPRCTGDLCDGDDHHGRYKLCCQCGNRIEPLSPVVALDLAAEATLAEHKNGRPVGHAGEPRQAPRGRDFRQRQRAQEGV